MAFSLLSSFLGLPYFSLSVFLLGFPLLTFLIFLLLLLVPSRDQLEFYFSNVLLLPCKKRRKINIKLKAFFTKPWYLFCTPAIEKKEPTRDLDPPTQVKVQVAQSCLTLWDPMNYTAGEGNGNPLQCSCLENPRDRGAWWAAFYGVTQSRTRLKRQQQQQNYIVHGILQARILEWVAFPFSRGSSQLRDWTHVSLSAEPQGKPKDTGVGSLSFLQRIFLTQESNRGLLHCRWILYQLSYEGSPKSRINIS